MLSNDDRYVWLVELTGFTDASTSAVYRFATRRYMTARTDSPADTYYEDRVQSIGLLTRAMFANGQSGARATTQAQVGFGSIRLVNIDGALDAIFDNPAISFRERQVLVYRLEQGLPYAQAKLMIRGAISQAARAKEFVEVSIKDRLYELQSPHVTTLFLGNNALPNGVEGVTDIQGKAKPVIYGKVLQVGAICVNTSRLEYQVSTRAIQSGIAYDGGGVLTAGADYTSQVDMETTAPSAGQVRWWPAGGMFRLGSTPARMVTVDIVGDTSANSTAAQILKRMALDRGIAAGDISAADVTALDALNSAVCGIYIDDQANTVDLMDQIARSVGAWYGFDRLGVLRMGRFDAPTGTASAVVANWNAESVDSLTNGEDVPTATINVRYARYYDTQSPTELVGSVTMAQRSDFGQAFRVSSYTGTLSPNPHKRTLVATRDTLLTAKADADAEATRLFGITGVPRRTHLAKGVRLDGDIFDNVDLGTKLALRWPRYLMDNTAGTLRVVIGAEYDLLANSCNLTLWGA